MTKNDLNTNSLGVILPVKVQPNAQVSKIIAWEGDELKIRLHAVPEDGKANKELIRFLAKIFQIPQSKIHLIHGETNRHKRVCIEEMKVEEVLICIERNFA